MISTFSENSLITKIVFSPDDFVERGCTAAPRQWPCSTVNRDSVGEETRLRCVVEAPGFRRRALQTPAFINVCRDTVMVMHSRQTCVQRDRLYCFPSAVKHVPERSFRLVSYKVFLARSSGEVIARLGQQRLRNRPYLRATNGFLSGIVYAQ